MAVFDQLKSILLVLSLSNVSFVLGLESPIAK